jgi:hypothetical protein
VAPSERRSGKLRGVLADCGDRRQAVRIHVGNSELVKALLEYFQEQADCIALQVTETEIEVSLLGSFRNDVHDATVEKLVETFRLYRLRPVE